MNKFYSKIGDQKSEYSKYGYTSVLKCNSISPQDRQQLLQGKKKGFVQKITISKKDQNVAYWEMGKIFGDHASLLDISEEEKDRYVREFGENVVMQGYLNAKVRYRINVQLIQKVEKRREKASNNTLLFNFSQTPDLPQTTPMPSSIPTSNYLYLSQKYLFLIFSPKLPACTSSTLKSLHLLVK